MHTGNRQFLMTGCCVCFFSKFHTNYNTLYVIDYYALWKLKSVPRSSIYYVLICLHKLRRFLSANEHMNNFSIRMTRETTPIERDWNFLKSRVCFMRSNSYGFYLREEKLRQCGYFLRIINVRRFVTSLYTNLMCK